ncbi:DNA cytosine methyltransferase [bacterium]|nr:DNA cytosine methyltransferase [bacterium]
MTIPVIDLFAGPGGLGEGFSSILNKKNERVFDIKLSIEKDEHAHKTLQLRSFVRQFPVGKIPKDYYYYVKNYNYRTDKIDRSKLFDTYPIEADTAIKEAWLCELGNDEYPNELVDSRIKNALKGKKNWMLIGGPPCQAYSLVGRSRRGGISVDDHRVFLYQQYLRIIAVHQPKVFVMENVKGLLSAKLDEKSIFQMIKEDLNNPGKLFPHSSSKKYRIFSLVQNPIGFDDEGNPIYKQDRDFLIQAEKFGIPQKRHRVILMGIREDVKHNGFNPLEQKDEITLKQVIGDLPIIRSGIGREITGKNDKGRNQYKKIENNYNNWESVFRKNFVKLNAKFKIELNLSKQFHQLDQGANYIPLKMDGKSNPLSNWFYDNKMGGILNHEARKHLKEDLGRYLFSALFLQKNGDFPRIKDYPKELLPNHKSAHDVGKFSDRFRTQKPDIPATTVTSHISKDGHYFIHYDPLQCRSLTVREAARIQTFPDNYFFCGSKTHQFHQVGNAVPPLLAKQIANSILNTL